MALKHKAEFRDLDLNLMKVFAAVIATGNVTEAGRKLDLAQSSISHALARLRKVLGDPLFVKTTSGMQPTPFAEQLAEPISHALASIEAAIFSDRVFDPFTSARTFNLLCTDAGEMIFLPELLKHISKVAPKVRVVVHQRERSNYREALEGGQVDLALGQLPTLHVDFYQQRLFNQAIVCVARPGHPLAADASIAQFLECDHLIVDSPAIAEQYVARSLGAVSSRRKIKAVIRHYMTAPLILAGTDYVAMLPRSVVEEHLRTGLIEEIDCGFDIAPITMMQFWHARTNRDPGCRWLRQTIASRFMHAAGD
ncbi:LysR family transcriptional regulator [Sphingopyxis sp.]|uniref:LysR family transcriptional regulator n=1 Tax=Sphingopyxis sp. TaxID=1908224 RepID=UPI002D76ECF3|nr:LysR family transcriptional regulator [Sphingopyxis sp.]HET6522888.1 LysR family transcriptional regulator [Sphingopyxis sp.]